MTDLNSTIESAAETAADTAVTTGIDFIAALLAAKVPGVSSIIVPLEQEGAQALEKLIATYVPKAVNAAEHEIPILWDGFIADCKALFAKHAPARLVPVGSPLDLLSNADLAYFAGLVTHELGTANVYTAPSGAHWDGAALMQNETGIKWLMKARGLAK